MRTLLLSAHRYVAYTSDIGESFRPIAHPILVRSAYAISWTYLLGDVGHEGYKAYLRNRRVLAPPCEAYKDSSDLTHQEVVLGMATGNVAGPLNDSPSSSGSSRPSGQEAGGGDTLTPWPTARVPLIEDYRVVMAQRALFQGLASMGLPALTIHTVVRYSGRALKGAKSTFMRTWAPIGVFFPFFSSNKTLIIPLRVYNLLTGTQLGLSVVPFLPYIFDHPVENAIDWVFRNGLRIYGGEDAIRELPRHSEVSRTGKDQDHEDPTSLDHFHIKVQKGEAPANGNVRWEDYKEDLLRAKEQRKREREERGESGILAMLGFGSKQKENKNKTE